MYIIRSPAMEPYIAKHEHSITLVTAKDTKNNRNLVLLVFQQLIRYKSIDRLLLQIFLLAISIFGLGEKLSFMKQHFASFSSISRIQISSICFYYLSSVNNAMNELSLLKLGNLLDSLI